MGFMKICESKVLLPKPFDFSLENELLVSLVLLSLLGIM